jgi:hypothetical protein
MSLNNEFEMMWKKAAVARFKALCRDFFKEPRKTTKYKKICIVSLHAEI